MSKNYGLTGVATDVEIGKGGGRIVQVSSTTTAIRQSDGTTDGTLTVADGVAAQDAVAFNQLSTVSGNAILRDGTQPATADIPFGGFQITNLADGTLATDAATVGQVTAVETAAILRDGSQAATADIPFGGNRLTNVGNGTVGTDAVNLNQLNDVAAGAGAFFSAVRVATAAALPAATLTGGNVLTADANGSLNAVGIDGVTTLLVGDRVLVKDENAGGADVENQIYEITDLGSAGTPWVLTQAADFDGSPVGEVIQNKTVFIEEGATQTGNTWAILTPNPITPGTTAIDWGLKSQTLIPDGSITTAKLANEAVTTAKLDQTPGSEAVSTATIRDDAVTNDKIADDAVDTAQLADGAVDEARLDTALRQSLTRHARAVITDASGASTTLVTAASLLNSNESTQVIIDVRETFNGTSPTLQVGTGAQPGLYADVDLSDLETVGDYIVDVADDVNSDVVITFASGGSTQGEAIVKFYYDEFS